MAINTSGYAVNGSIPTLIGPTTKPVVFNYANGQTMAPTSGGAAYATGMASMGQSLGGALQEAAQNLNANTIAKNQAARAQANMQTQLTPMQTALAQAQMARDTGQANYFTGIWGQENQAQQQLLAQRAAQQQMQPQQSAQGTPMPGSPSSNAPSSPMPPLQSNGLIGLNPASAALVQPANTPNSYSVNSSLGAMPSSIGPIKPDLAGTGLKYDELSQKSQEMNQANTNMDAEKVQSTFDNEAAVKDYNTAASNRQLVMQIKDNILKGKSPTNADTVNLMKAAAGVFNPDGSSKAGFDPVNVITQQNIPSQIKTAIASFTGDKSNIMSDQTALDLANAVDQSFAQQTNNYNVTRANYISRLGGTNLNTPQIINSRLIDRPAIAAQQYGWNKQQKQSAAPQAIQSLAAKAKAIHAANPNLTPQQAMQMASGSQ